MSIRRWTIDRVPDGPLDVSDFGCHEDCDGDDPLREGQIRLRALLFHCVPSQRTWIGGPNPLVPMLRAGSTMLGPVGGEVIESATLRFPVGTLVTTFGPWREVFAVDTAAAGVEAIAPGLSLVEAMGAFGFNPRTAYFGLLRIGEPRPGEMVLVSSAAGSVGSVAAQIARLQGCSVTVTAGGAEKCRWLRETCGFDACIDYQAEDVPARLDQLCPAGIDVYFDNVGGPVLQAAIARMAHKGRVVLCGQISSYDGGTDTPIDMMRVIYGSIRLQGFLQRDFTHERDEAIADLKRWMATGQIVYRDNISSGFESLPASLLSLFSGGNNGTTLVAVRPEAAASRQHAAS